MDNIYTVFNIARGTRLTKRDQVAGDIPFITAGSIRDGFKQKITNTAGLTLHQNSITIDMFGFVKYRNYAFYCDDNIIVLTPKNPIHENVLIYMSLFLQQQTAGQYDYGRQCRLKNIGNFEVPSLNEIPEWVYAITMPTFNDIAESKTQDKAELPPVNQWKDFKYPDIFILKRGAGGKASDADKNPGSHPYIGASDQNNGITKCTSLDTTEPANSITVANNGSVGAAFYQAKPYLASSDITVLTLKNYNLTPAIAMFLITLIRQEGEKVNYGRKWGISRMKESVISLPVTEQGEPDWDLMERYINSLPYSKYL